MDLIFITVIFMFLFMKTESAVTNKNNTDLTSDIPQVHQKGIQPRWKLILVTDVV